MALQKIESLLALRLRLADDAAPAPAGLVEREQLHVAAMAPQPLPDLAEQRALVGAAQVAAEGAVLEALEAVVQARVGDALARAVVGDVVDQQALHRSPPHHEGLVVGAVAAHKGGDVARLALEDVAQGLAL